MFFKKREYLMKGGHYTEVQHRTEMNCITNVWKLSVS